MGKIKDRLCGEIENIYGLDLARNGGNMTVCKSIPLLSLVQSPLSLFEMKLFDIYLGRIHPQNPDVTRITFEKSELEELLGVEKINNSELNKALRNLMSMVVTVYNGNEKILCTLLSTAKLSYIDRDHERLNAITMECSNAARKYIYNLSSIKYIKMSLLRLVSFDSRHAYAMYQYLNANSYRSHWDVDLYELKSMLGVQGKYPQYRDFNKRVLQPALEEINEKTELTYSFEPLLKRGKVRQIRFTIIHTDEKLEKNIDVEVKKSIPQTEKAVTEEIPNFDEELPVYDEELPVYDDLYDIEF